MTMLRTILLAGLITAVLPGCGGDDSSSSTTITPMTLSVSDAPSDEMLEVVVVFSKVALLPIDDDDAEPMVFNLDPVLSVNLLDYQGSDAKALIENENIAVGSYKMCVFANDGDHPSDPSYVIHSDDGMLPLTVKGDGSCPQGVGKEDNTGVLYFNETFNVNTSNNDFVVEFDLRRGIKAGTDDDYTIQRTSVDIVNSVETGALGGDVSDSLFGSCETETTSGTGFTHAVYLYSGNVAQEDMGPFAGTSGETPVTAANVLADEESGDKSYQFGYLTPGTYSVGYTCVANNDSEDGITEGETFSIYSAVSGVEVVADEEAEADF